MPLTIEQKKQLMTFVPRLQMLEKDFIVALNDELLKTTEQDPQALSFLRLLENFRERLEKAKEDFDSFIGSVGADNRKYTAVTREDFNAIFARITSLQYICLNLIGRSEISFSDARSFKGTEKEIKDKLKAMQKFLKDYVRSVAKDLVLVPSLEAMQRSLTQPATLEVLQRRLFALRCQQRQEFLRGELRHSVVKTIFSGIKIKLDEDLQAHYDTLTRSLPEKIERAYAEEMLKALWAIEFVGDNPSVLRRVTADGMMVALTTQRLLDECEAHVAVLTNGGHGKESTWAESSVTRAEESLKQARIWIASAMGKYEFFPEVVSSDSRRVPFMEVLRDLLRTAIARLQEELDKKTAVAGKKSGDDRGEHVAETAASAAPAPEPAAAVLCRDPSPKLAGANPDLAAGDLSESLPEKAPVVSSDAMLVKVPPAASSDHSSPLPVAELAVGAENSGLTLSGELGGSPSVVVPVTELAVTEQASAAALKSTAPDEEPALQSRRDESSPPPLPISDGSREESIGAERKSRIRMSMAYNPALAAMAELFRRSVEDSAGQQDDSIVAAVVPTAIQSDVIITPQSYILRLQELRSRTDLSIDDLSDITKMYFFFYDQNGNQVHHFTDDKVYDQFDECYGEIQQAFDLTTGVKKVFDEAVLAELTAAAVVEQASVVVAPHSAFLAPPKPSASGDSRTPQGEMRIRMSGILQGALLDKFINGMFTQWVERGSVPEKATLESACLTLMGRAYSLGETQVDTIINAARDILLPKDTPKP